MGYPSKLPSHPLSSGRCDSAIPNFLSSPPRFLFYFRRLIVDSTVPADLLKLKARLEDWRATRRYAHQPIPVEFRQAAAEMARRYSPSVVRRVLKLDPWRLKKPETKRSDRVHRKPQTTFFTLPPDIALPEPRPVATSLAAASIADLISITRYYPINGPITYNGHSCSATALRHVNVVVLAKNA